MANLVSVMKGGDKRTRKKIILVGALLVVLILLIIGTMYAFFFDGATGNFDVTAGTVKLKANEVGSLDVLIELDPDGDDTDYVNNMLPPEQGAIWNPGEVRTIEWTVENIGNKSVYTRNLLMIAWDVPVDMPELGVLYIYPEAMTDDDVRTDIDGGALNAIPIGPDTYNVKATNNDTKGYWYVFLGNVLDGVGTGAEDTDSRTPGSSTHDLPDNTFSQTLRFKIAFSAYAPLAYQNLDIYMKLEAEALQFRNNTIDDGIYDDQWRRKIPKPEPDETTMQTFTTIDCSFMTVGEVEVLADIRDSQNYQVRKMEDNRCWMIDNLKLELTNGMVLDPADTAVPSATTVWFTGDGTSSGTPLTGMTGNFTNSGVFLTVDGSANTGSNQDAWRQIDPAIQAWCANSTNWPTGSLTGCGYFYNFYTATAGTVPWTQGTNYVASTGSICPAGWRLPVSNANAALNDFAVLNGFMNGDGAASVANSGSYVNNWLATGPWRGIMGGLYNTSGVLANQGDATMGWSASVATGTTTYALQTLQLIPGMTMLFPATQTVGRSIGIPLRCVL